MSVLPRKNWKWRLVYLARFIDFKVLCFWGTTFFEIAVPDFKYIIVESMTDITFLYGVYYYFMV